MGFIYSEAAFLSGTCKPFAARYGDGISDASIAFLLLARVSGVETGPHNWALK